MIQYKQIKPQTVDLWSDDYGFIANVNEEELNDIRIQIKEQKATGYYCFFNGEKIYINSVGKFEKWPKGFFDLLDQQLSILY